MLLTKISKVAVGTLVPKFLEGAYDYVFGEEEEETKDIKTEPEPVNEEKYRDRSRWNKKKYDIIVNMRKDYCAYCVRYDILVDENTLTKDTNAALGLNKNKRAFKKIWTGKVDRKKLPEGN